MLPNDVLRSLRYLLDISDAELAAIAQLADTSISSEAIAAYLCNDDEVGFVPCSDAVLGSVLDGLIIHRRGRDDSRAPQPLELPLSNNTILKKLRVAFELKEEDMHAILDAAEFPLSKPELSALFRKPGHHNYRPCGDQLLRKFLKGLTLRERR